MTLEAFKNTLASEDAPHRFSTPLKALWADANGRWDDAHALVQSDEGRHAAWVHAYLHRKEGDLSNASYWYRRAGRRASSGSLEKEWELIASALLSVTHHSKP